MIEKREFYKKLKERGIFWKFCLAVAQAYSSTTSSFSPKERYDNYYNFLIRDIDIETFINSIKFWDINLKDIKIL